MDGMEWNGEGNPLPSPGAAPSLLPPVRASAFETHGACRAWAVSPFFRTRIVALIPLSFALSSPLFFFQVVTIDPKNANKTALLEQLHAAKAALKADLTSLPIEKKEKVPVPTAGPT